MGSRQAKPAATVIQLERLAWLLVVASVIVIPCLVSSGGKDAMRLPKDLAFLASVIAIGTLFALSLPFRRSSPPSFTLRTVPVIATAATAWTLIGCVGSTNRTISIESLVWVTTATAFVMAIDWLARERSPMTIAWVLVPAIVNAAIFLLQRFHIWNPITFDTSIPEHFRYTALIGNPDDVGSFFVAPVIIATALFVVDIKRRVRWGASALLLMAGIATGTLTPMVASAVGLLALGFTRSRKLGAIISGLLLVGAVILVISFAPLRLRVSHVAAAIRARQYAEAFSGRVTPFLAAGRMALDHPLMGVGPGCFRWEYFPYKLSVEAKHPQLALAYAAMFNFGEVHNDHLQILAECGIIGYAVFAAALICLAAVSFSGSGRDEPQRGVVARTLAFPLAIAFAVLALAHFPLHLTAPTIAILYAATLCVTWSELAELRLPRISMPLVLHGTPWRAAASLATIVAVSLAVWGIRTWCYDRYTCNTLAARTEPSTLAALASADQYHATTIARANLDLIARCLERAPASVEIYMIAAANYRTLRRLEDAARIYRTALTYDRRPELYYNLGIVELQLRQRDAAVADLLTAVRFSREYLSDIPNDVRAQLVSILRQRYPYLLGT